MDSNTQLKLAPFVGVPRPCSVIVGMAVCPQAAQKLRDMFKSDPPLPWDMPLIIDPRLNLDNSEVYRDEEKWRERMREQNAWDSQNVKMQELSGGE